MTTKRSKPRAKKRASPADRSKRKRKPAADPDNGPRWVSNGAISLQGIWQLSFEIDDNEAHPDDVGAALEAILAALGEEDVYDSKVTENGVVADEHRVKRPGMPAEIPPAMTRLLWVVLTRYVDKGMPLDRAFGVVRGRGQPPATPAKRQHVAADVIRLLLKGRSVESAATTVGAEHEIPASTARKYYARHKVEGAARLREDNGRPYTPREQARLDQILNREPTTARSFRQRAKAQATPKKDRQ